MRFDGLTHVFGQVAVVWRELVRDSFPVAAAGKQIGIDLDEGTCVREYEVVLTTQVSEQVLGYRCLIPGRSLFDRHFAAGLFGNASFAGRHRWWGRDIAAELQLERSAIRLRLNHHDPLRIGRAEEHRRLHHVAKGRGQTNTWRPATDRELDTAYERLQLGAPRRREERVQLIDHDVAQPGKQSWNLGATVDERRLQRLRRDQQHTGRVSEHFLFRRA